MSRLSAERMRLLNELSDTLSRNPSLKVIIFEGGYHPDGIVVNWHDRRVYAIEAYTSRKSIPPDIKARAIIAGFDGVIIRAPKSRFEEIKKLRPMIAELFRYMTADRVVEEIKRKYGIEISKSTVYKVAKEYGVKKRLLSKDK